MYWLRVPEFHVQEFRLPTALNDCCTVLIGPPVSHALPRLAHPVRRAKPSSGSIWPGANPAE